MARTAAFDRLTFGLSVAREAEDRGLPTHEAIGIARERTDRRITRRQFLGGAAKLAAAAAATGVVGRAALATPPAHAGRPSTDARVGVVGAGMAGLACAHRLKGSGVPCTVFEASSRVGGRIHSLGGPFPGPVEFGGLVVERGGEFIDTLHGTMRGYARTFNLPLEEVTKVPGVTTYFLDGRLVPEVEVIDEFRALVAAMRRDLRLISQRPTAAAFSAADEHFDRMTLDEYLTTRGAGDVIRQVVASAYTGEFGSDPGDLGALAFLLYIHADRRSKFRPFGVFSDERFHVIGGNEGIPRGLAAELGGGIELGHRLVAARRSATGEVTLTFDTGGPMVERAFDQVVFATPFSTLRGADLSGLGLPSWKLRAINELVYGANAKMMVGFAGRPWWELHGSNGATYADLGALHQTWETNPANAGPTRGVLTDYTGGDLARSIGTGSVQDRAEDFLADLDRVLPGAAARAIRGPAGVHVHLEHWPSNPLTLGAYTTTPPGYFTTIADYEGASVGNLHFAGEHASSFYEWQGFMEGAALTGLAAAKTIVKLVR